MATYGIDKRCPRCGEVKPLSEFYRQVNGHYSSYCKPCNNAYSRAYLNRRYAEEPEFREAVKAKVRKWHAENKQRRNERQRRRYAEDPDFRERAHRWQRANPDARRIHERLYRYKMSRELFDARIADQDARCAICREPFATTPRIDHIHDETGRVRGLLCDYCNRGIGYFKEKPEALRAAADYLEYWEARFNEPPAA